MKCAVCSELATECSAHFACCVWFCPLHSAQFHEPHHIAKLRAALSTAALLEQVRSWILWRRAWVERQALT